MAVSVILSDKNCLWKLGSDGFTEQRWKNDMKIVMRHMFVQESLVRSYHFFNSILVDLLSVDVIVFLLDQNSQ